MTPAWRVAAALALACELDWGRWAAGWTAQCTCEPYRGRDGKGSRLYHNDRCISESAMDERGIADSARDPYVEHRATPVADPSDAAAYLADCARRGVEPGPLPAREYATGEVAWVVAPERDGTVDYVAVRAGGGIEVSTQEDHPHWSVCPNSRCTAADLALLSTLVTAAAAALETSPAGREEASELLGEVKAKRKALKAEREKITKPLHAAWKAAIAFFDKPDGLLAELETELKRGIAAGLRRAEAIAAAQLAAAHERHDADAMACVELENPLGITVRLIPRVRYTDASLVPRHLCEPSHSLVLAALEAGEAVPGAELYFEDSVTKRG